MKTEGLATTVNLVTWLYCVQTLLHAISSDFFVSFVSQTSPSSPINNISCRHQQTWITFNHQRSIDVQPVIRRSSTLPDSIIPHYPMSISNCSMGLRSMKVFHGGVVVVSDTNGNAVVDTDVRTNGDAKPYFLSTWCAAMDYEKTTGLAQMIMRTFMDVELPPGELTMGLQWVSPSTADGLAIVNSLSLLLFVTCTLVIVYGFPTNDIILPRSHLFLPLHSCKTSGKTSLFSLSLSQLLHFLFYFSLFGLFLCVRALLMGVCWSIRTSRTHDHSRDHSHIYLFSFALLAPQLSTILTDTEV